MGGLLAGHAPLRGRAGLELIVHPLDYRDAARFCVARTRLHCYSGAGFSPELRSAQDADIYLVDLDQLYAG
jgi:hypothetical protein